MISLKLLLRIVAYTAVAILIWALWFYQPGRQLERAHTHLLKTLESRNWNKLRAMTADDFMAGLYAKNEAIENGREILQPFFSIHFTESEKTLRREGPQSVISTRIHMEGSGMGYAPAVVSVVNDQKDPFVFTWQQMSWKPWDWKLVRAEHPLFHY